MTDSQKYRLTIAYEGTRYKGWQRLKQTPETIQGKVESVLSRIFEIPIQIDGASRTDAGVHAKAQVASFSAPIISCEVLSEQLNKYLPKDIAVTSVNIAPTDFHARFKAKHKTYHYVIWRAPYRPIFERNVVTVVDGPLDVGAMRSAAKLLVGKLDFKGFSSDKTKKSTIRTLASIEIMENSETITLIFKGDGFLYNMVRIIVGTLIEVGQGKRTEEDIKETLTSKVRSTAGETAPAEGLTLVEVAYDKLR